MEDTQTDNTEEFLDEELKQLMARYKPKENPLANTKIIAVSSCKGGVGKSTTAVNIAASISKLGYKVGILDADIYGPSVPLLLGVNNTKTERHFEENIPVMAYNIQAMSIGFMIDEDQSVTWRGPMLDSMIHHLMYKTKWDVLEYLIVDMPPGTGDIQISMSNKMNLAGAVIVTTPQEIALLDVQKGIQMFKDSNIPILGIVENMSLFVCPNCNHTSHIFGEGGAKKMMKKFNTKLLGSIPINQSIRDNSDKGIPLIFQTSEKEISKIYKNIALKVIKELASM